MSIDPWTLALQTVNVLVLIWILQRFLFRPVLAMVDRRRAEIEQSLQAAETARQAATADRAATQARLGGIHAEADALQAEARDAATRQVAVIMAEGEQALAEKRTAATAAIAAERAAAEAEIAEAASHLGQHLACRLLQGLPGNTAFTHFLSGLTDLLRQAPAATREDLAAAARSAEGLELRSAAALSADELTACRAALAQVLGFDPALRNVAVPGLIAGLELHAPHCSLLNSWGADLATLKADLAGRAGKPA